MSHNPDLDSHDGRIALALERIADTLDDFMDMSLGAQRITSTIARDPEGALVAFTELLADLERRRAER